MPKPWNWTVEKRLVADLEKLASEHGVLKEIAVSPDGETAGAIFDKSTSEATIAVGERCWEGALEKAWHLRFCPDGRALALVRIDDAWTVMVDGTPWEESFDFAWNTKVTTDGKTIAAQIKRDNKYGVAVNGAPWGNLFISCRDYVLSADGQHAAATVQLEELPEADIAKFREGTWGVAVDGTPWGARFMNAYAPTFSPDSAHVAAEVRTEPTSYSVAQDGEAWKTKYGCVWEPRFKGGGTVIVPVRQQGAWTLAENGAPFWKNRFVQLWHPTVATAGDHVAAVVATAYGQWTVAVDDVAWPTAFSDMVLAPHFSPDGRRVAAVFKDDGRWGIVVDGRPWSKRFDMVWEPVFSPDGARLVAKVEVDGRPGLTAGGQVWTSDMDRLWDPVFSPDGKHVLVRGMTGGKVFRQVIPAAELGS